MGNDKAKPFPTQTHSIALGYSLSNFVFHHKEPGKDVILGLISQYKNSVCC